MTGWMQSFPAFAVFSAYDWLKSRYLLGKMGQVACGEQGLYGQTDSTNKSVYIPTHASAVERWWQINNK